ncbi:nitric oxide reductase [Chitinophaga flava]|uniref:Nitric oxide reductase n=2 Tax=Chitinophaga flava TaxID=2259036 RepID=A0A365Y685_9BACT|nr:nitric oxide reductase [Chitinophaga flava]
MPVKAEETQSHRNFYYPPGGLLMWIVILLELLTFGIAIVIMLYYAGEERALFHTSAAKLNRTIGSVNTVVLLTSGYCMARCVGLFRTGTIKQSDRQLLYALMAGMVFLTLKSVEYGQKAAEGLTLGENTFFDFYWMLTGFHVIHVIIGMVILIYWKTTRSRRTDEEAMQHLEAGAAFWHLCDLIWLLLFPVLYLIF